MLHQKQYLSVLSNPNPFAPLYILKCINCHCRPIRIGYTKFSLFESKLFLNTKSLVNPNTNLAINPENIIDKNDNTIPLTPPIYGNVSTVLYQITHCEPFKVIAIPIIPPTQLCVVDTNIS